MEKMINTQLIKVNPNSEIINQAGEIIRSGGLVAFPTETVYGLGANGLNGEACRKIYEAKGRPSDNPLILHIANFEMISRIAINVPHQAEKLLTAFCPGPLTLILPKSKAVPMSVTGGLETVGVRMPDNEIARALIKAANCPIAAPSANLSGRPSPVTAQAVYNDLNGKIPLILDGGACNFGLESTIVDLTTEVATILRPGAITKEMLEEVIGEVAIDSALVDDSKVPKAPGMKYTHYAPKIPMILIANKSGVESKLKIFRREMIKLISENKYVGVIASSKVISGISDLTDSNLIVNYGDNLKQIAANIYESLRYFDNVQADFIIMEGTVKTGIGAAIMNRLEKASSKIIYK